MTATISRATLDLMDLNIHCVMDSNFLPQKVKVELHAVKKFMETQNCRSLK